MSRPRRAALALLLVLLVLTGCATPAARAPLLLTVLHTNDHHGRFWSNADGEYGLAARKTLVDRVRAEVKAAGGQVLLLDGGDVNTGVPESDLQDAEPDFKGMGLLGYDAMAVGNHEFDKPAAVLAKQRGWASFPLLSANIYVGGERLFAPSQVFERGGYRIAVVGLTTEDTRKITLPSNVAGVEFRPALTEAAAVVPALRRGADMVIGLTHLGHYPDGRHGVNGPGDVELARAVPGFDLIVGGHTHSPVCMAAENTREEAYVPGGPCKPDRQNGAWIVQAHEWGKYLGRADFEVSGPGKVRLLRYALLPVNLVRRGADGKKAPVAEPLPEDPGVRAFLKPFRDAGQAQLGLPVGTTRGPFDGARDHVRSRATDLGQLVTRAMRARTGADLAIVNSGGLRDSLPGGTIAYRDVLKVHPFGGTVVVLRLTGQELWSYLQVVARVAPGSGGFPQVAGAQLRVVGGELAAVSLGGQPLDRQREYVLAVNAFVASGGDGYPKVTGHPGFRDTGVPDAEVLRDYLAQHGPLDPADFVPVDGVVRE